MPACTLSRNSSNGSSTNERNNNNKNNESSSSLTRQSSRAQQKCNTAPTIHSHAEPRHCNNKQLNSDVEEPNQVFNRWDLFLEGMKDIF